MPTRRHWIASFATMFLAALAAPRGQDAGREARPATVVFTIEGMT